MKSKIPSVSILRMLIRDPEFVLCIGVPYEEKYRTTKYRTTKYRTTEYRMTLYSRDISFSTLKAAIDADPGKILYREILGKSFPDGNVAYYTSANRKGSNFENLYSYEPELYNFLKTYDLHKPIIKENKEQ